MKIPNIRGFEQIAVSHSRDSDYDDFERFLRKYTADQTKMIGKAW